MPIYTYKCPECCNTKDVLGKMSDDAPFCNNCSKPVPRKYVRMEKVISGGFFKLKGDGWAKDGYCKKEKGKPG
jgi:putative FmdB family regulatory protein